MVKKCLDLFVGTLRGTIFRIKGILAVKNHPFKHVFHAVMDVSDEADAEAWGKDEKRITKIVFIGDLPEV